MLVRPGKKFTPIWLKSHEKFDALHAMEERDVGDIITSLLSCAMESREPTFYRAYAQSLYIGGEGYLPKVFQLISLDEAICYSGWDAGPNVMVTDLNTGEQVAGRELLRRKMRKLYGDKFDDLMEIFFSAWVQQDSPTVIRWMEWNNYTSSYRARQMSLVKFCRMLNRKFDFRIPEEVAEEWSERWGQAYKVVPYKFVWSELPSGTYEMEYFGSCMFDSDAPKFYDDQANVDLLEIWNEDTDELAGRVLVWSNVMRRNDDGTWEEGLTVMDRVYPSDGGSHELAAIKFAQEQGWIYKEYQGYGAGLSRPGVYKVEVDVSSDHFPYMDTFYLGGFEGTRYFLSNVFGEDEWTSTDNYVDIYGDDEGCDEYDDGYWF